MEAHSSILAWEIPWTEEPGGLQSTGHKGLDMPEGLNNNKEMQYRLLFSSSPPARSWAPYYAS